MSLGINLGGNHGMGNRTGLRSLACLCVWGAAVGCSNDSAPPDPSGTDVIAGALVNIQNTWEDGTNQGWIPRGPVTLTNTTEQAFAGTRSLKTTGRTAGFNGPSLNLTGQMFKGATYQIGVAVRLVPGGVSPTTIRVTMQRTLVGGSNAF